MAEKRGDVWSERELLQVLVVFVNIAPADLSFKPVREHLARQALYAAVEIEQFLFAPHRERERAVAHYNGSDSVSDRLFEAGKLLDLCVVMGMNIEQARHDPSPGCVYLTPASSVN